MCGTCGCGRSDVRVDLLQAGHGDGDGHVHGDGHGHPHRHEPVGGTVEIETALLAKNDHLAGHNRAWLAERGILVAPGDFYGAAGAQHVRVALTATDERVDAAAQRLSV